MAPKMNGHIEWDTRILQKSWHLMQSEIQKNSPDFHWRRSSSHFFEIEWQPRAGNAAACTPTSSGLQAPRRQGLL